MNNETAPILKELKQECKAIKKSQTELRTALVEQQNTKPQDDTQVPQTVHLQLSQETKAKIKEHQLFCFGGIRSNQLQTASDYDLRYRYLRMQGKATKKDFEYLDSIFITHRNHKAIQQIQQKVIDYKQALQRQAELLIEQKRILQEQDELKKHLNK